MYPQKIGLFLQVKVPIKIEISLAASAHSNIGLLCRLNSINGFKGDFPVGLLKLAFPDHISVGVSLTNNNQP